MAYSFSALGAVSGVITQWSIVFDVGCRGVWFRTRRNPSERFLDLSDVDFSSHRPAQMLNVDAGEAGSVSQLLADYSHDVNVMHQKRALEGLGAQMREEDLRAWIRHFEEFSPVR